jgi:Outer membrane lipoprotein-sorting protein
MTRRIFQVLLLLAGLSVLGSDATAASSGEPALTVNQIVDRTNHVAYYQGSDGRAKVKMTITDAQGRQRNRELVILRWDQPDPQRPVEGQSGDDSYCGDQKIYAFFSRPADVYKTVFLVWKHLDKDDDRWMYLPALDLVKRISATDKRTSFVGAHFFYEDVSGRRINDDVHELVKTTKDYYVLKNTPKDPSLVEFAYFEMWIHRSSFTVVKTDYYDAQDRKYRSYEALEVKQIQGKPTVTKAKMTDLRTNGNTLLEYSDVTYDIGIPESVFTERYLRKPARKYLK